MEMIEPAQNTTNQVTTWALRNLGQRVEGHALQTSEFTTIWRGIFELRGVGNSESRVCRDRGSQSLVLARNDNCAWHNVWMLSAHESALSSVARPVR